MMFEEYVLAFLGLWLIGMTILAQQFIAVYVHRTQGSKFVPGKFDQSLGPDSFVFRTERTFRNSLENIIQFLIPCFIAIHLGVGNMALAAIVWLYAIARIGHIVAYYKDTTTDNPSLKSYFFLSGLILNIILMLVVMVRIFTM